MKKYLYLTLIQVTCTVFAFGQNCVTFTDPSVISLSCSKTDLLTSSSDGTASVVATGGTPPYTYVWSNNATTSSISSLMAGTYTVSVSDANNCLQATCTSNVNTNICNLPNLGSHTITSGSCNGLIANNDARIDFTGITNADKTEKWEAATYAGGNYNTAILSVNLGKVSFTNLKHATAYTFRFWNISNSCFKDITVTTASKDCNTTCIVMEDGPTCCPQKICLPVKIVRN
jgi:hypothetical protein